MLDGSRHYFARDTFRPVRVGGKAANDVEIEEFAVCANQEAAMPMLNDRFLVATGWGNLHGDILQLKSDSESMDRRLESGKPQPLPVRLGLTTERFLVLERRTQERRQLPAVHIFVRCFTHCVMAARQNYDFVVQLVAFEFVDDLAREIRQECQIVFRVEDERLARPA